MLMSRDFLARALRSPDTITLLSLSELDALVRQARAAGAPFAQARATGCSPCDGTHKRTPNRLDADRAVRIIPEYSTQVLFRSPK